MTRHWEGSGDKKLVESKIKGGYGRTRAKGGRGDKKRLYRKIISPPAERGRRKTGEKRRANPSKKRGELQSEKLFQREEVDPMPGKKEDAQKSKPLLWCRVGKELKKEASLPKGTSPSPKFPR